MLKSKCLLPLLLSLVTLSACSSTKTTTRTPPYQVVEEKRYVSPEEAKEAYIAGNALLDKKDFSAAKEKYKVAVDGEPNSWQVYMNAAIATILDGRSDEALNLMRQALEHGGSEEQVVYFNLGNIYQERALYLAAANAYRAGLDVGDPNDIDSLTNLGATYILLSFDQEAEKTFNHIIELDPTNSAAYLGLAMVSALREEFAQAIKQYNDLISRNPDFAPTYYNKAELLELMQKPKEALESYKKYLEVAPDGPYLKQASNAVDRLRKF